ncbi:MAG: Lrp/AsnC family transcriptional regulator, regulator for asnA, asnC and gidA [Archaeoglobi archaeon]|nr:Lrp/AsnC family transcriptional regulator, regulator for asnA, asnC and gidA [Archaeoglobi archaeon]
MPVDERDKKILEMLMRNARIPKVRIAEELGVTEAAVRKRISRLEESGIIVGYRAVVDFKKSEMVASLTGVDVEPEALWRVIRSLRNIENVASLWLTTGDHALMMEIFANSTEELSRIHDEISEIPGVLRVCPSIILEVIK